MKIDILTVIPELLESPFSHSIIKRAQEKKILSLHIHGLRQWGLHGNKQVDDYPYGGGAGMVMRCEPLVQGIEYLQSMVNYDEVVYLCPDGELLTQPLANQLSLKKNLLLVCGHYKGIDQRIRDRWITKEISIGDYVLSGGELAAAVLVDSMVRLIPGVLSDESSALTDSFQDGMVAPPIYTRPAVFRDMYVPPILLEGDHKKIEEWRQEQAYRITQQRRPHLLH